MRRLRPVTGLLGHSWEVSSSRLVGFAGPVVRSSRPSRSVLPPRFNTSRALSTSRLEVKPTYLVYRHDQASSPVPSSTITYARLRDACECPECKHPHTRQKTHTPGHHLSTFPGAGEPSRLGHGPQVNDIQEINNGLSIVWPDGHHSTYTAEHLQALALTRAETPESRYLQKTARRIVWDRHTLLANSESLRTTFTELSEDGAGAKPDALLKVLEQLHIYGLAVITGVPTVKTSNAECSLRTVANMVGEIRNTFYGETWDVKNLAAESRNVAYTDLNLGLHMDLLYFSSPPRFQLLHCLRNRVEGGQSYFVDAFAAVERYRGPTALRDMQLEYEYDNDSHYLTHTHPIVTSDESSYLHAAVNWSPPFLGRPLTRFAQPQDAAEEKRHMELESKQYESLAEFERILEEEDLRYEFTMQEGDVVLFDNRRVLHARRAFRDLTEEERAQRGVEVQVGEPSRWLKGCYLDGEVVWDKLVTLNRLRQSGNL